jgi:hypothetical protein
VKSEGTNTSELWIGGISGLSSSNFVSECVVLVSTLDGDNSTPPNRAMYAIGVLTSGYPVSSNNYSRDDIEFLNFTNPGSYPEIMVDSTYTIGSFQNLGPMGDFSWEFTLGWNFTAGTGDWKWLSGYDYPVLQWQTTAPVGP